MILSEQDQLMVFKLQQILESPEGPPEPRVSYSIHLGWGLRTGISNKYPDDSDATSSGNYMFGTTGID